MFGVYSSLDQKFVTLPTPFWKSTQSTYPYGALYMQVYNGGLVDERMAAALKHIGSTVTNDGDEARKYAMTAVIMRCCQLLLQMTPFADDLNALASDPETEPQHQAYYSLLLKGVESVRQQSWPPSPRLGPDYKCPEPYLCMSLRRRHSTRPTISFCSEV